MKFDFREFVRFNIVGIANTVLAYGIFSLVFYLSGIYMAALIADYLWSITFSLILNTLFTFRQAEFRGIVTVVKMLATYGVMFLLNWLILYLMVDIGGLNEYLSQFFSIFFVALTSYLMQKLFVFSR